VFGVLVIKLLSFKKTLVVHLFKDALSSVFIVLDGMRNSKIMISELRRMCSTSSIVLDTPENHTKC
jgi:hypothetical protein